jgi:hypothetical protein
MNISSEEILLAIVKTITEKQLALDEVMRLKQEVAKLQEKKDGDKVIPTD